MTFGTKVPLQAPADEGKAGGTGAGEGGAAGADAKGQAEGGKGAAASAGEGTEKGTQSVLSIKQEKAEDPKGEGKSEGQGDPKKDGAKDELKLTLPEGVKLDEKAWAKFVPVARELGLNSEQASKLAAFQVGILSERDKASQDAWDQLRGGWYEELKSDKEFGGAKFEENVAMAQKALVRFGGQQLADELAKYGLDNHPGLAKAFAKVGRSIAEDSAADSNTERAKAPLTQGQRDLKMYPSLQKEARGGR